MRKRKPEFSKIMVIIATILVGAVVAFSFIVMWRAESPEGIEFVAVGSFAFLTLTYHRYYAKAEQENQIKLKATYGEDYIKLNDVSNGGEE